MCKFNFIMTESEFNRAREELLENISELFLKYGLRSTSMDDICSHLKISKKTLYQYFSNKDDLVEQIMMHRRNNYRTQKDIEELGKKLAVLEANYSDNPAYLALMRQKFELRKCEVEHNETSE